MTGNPENVKVWSRPPSILIGDITANDPTVTVDNGIKIITFDDTWDDCGMLEGGDGIEDATSSDSADTNGWGYGTVKTTKSNPKRVVTVTFMEENPTVQALYSTVGDPDENGVATEGNPDLNRRFKVAIIKHSADGEVDVRWSIRYAQVDSWGSKKDTETAPGTRATGLICYANADGDVFKTWNSVAANADPDAADDPADEIAPASIAIVGGDQTVTVGQTLNLSATETVDNHTVNLRSVDVRWTSATPANATVSNAGVVTGVAAGTSVITATYKGKTTTATITVQAGD